MATTKASRSPPTCRSISAIHAVLGGVAAERKHQRLAATVLSARNRSLAVFQAYLNKIALGSTNGLERPWALKRLPINYERCCGDRLNRRAEADVPNDLTIYESRYLVCQIL